MTLTTGLNTTIKKISVLVLSLVFLLAANALGSGQRAVNEIRELLRDPIMRGASVGLIIQDLDTGDTLARINADEAFIPASNMKLVTAGAAILALGPRHGFYTDFYAKRFDPATGVAYGLYVKGYGDPTMKAEFHDGSAAKGADLIAANLKKAGLKKLQGTLWLDDSFFDDVKRPVSWEEEDLDWCYAPRPGALAAGGNCLIVEATGAKSGGGAIVKLDPPPDPALTKINVKSVARGASKVTVRQASTGVITVSGKVARGKTIEIEYPVPHPALFYGSVLMGALKRAGVEVALDVRITDDVPVGYKFARRVPTLELMDVLSEMGRHSDNFVAEQMLRVIGALQGEGGTHEAGAKVASEIMKRFNIATDETLSISDGSGLSRNNRLTPDVLNALLSAFYNSYLKEEFRDVLAQPGERGTLKKRLLETHGRFWAKTGALRGVCALSGYFIRRNGNTASFTIIMNGYTVHSNHVRTLQDKIVLKMLEM